jgi:hypothetical protein
MILVLLTLIQQLDDSVKSVSLNMLALKIFGTAKW